MGNLRWKVLVAELFGTAVLMLGGPGSAVLAAKSIGVLGVALAFGVSLLVMAYVIGPISGCHINPAVTVGLALMKTIPGALVPYYIIGQVAGAAGGGLIVFGIAKGVDGFDAHNNFAANGWGAHSPGGYNLAASIIVEIVLTALLVFAVIATTSKKFAVGQGGIVVGLTLTLIHLISIPVDNTSVNPARSFGATIFAGGDALAQLWAFIVFPIVGALVGVLVWVAVDDARITDTVIGELID